MFQLSNLWAGFVSTWPIWLVIAVIVTYAVWAVSTPRATRRADAARRERDEATLRTLDHIAATDPDPEVRVRAGLHRAEVRRRQLEVGRG